MYKDKSLFINILLVVWQLPQIILGLIMLAIFHNKKTYTNPYNHITVWNINCHNAFGYACFSLGPIIVTCDDNVSERTRRHETGHSKQSVILGIFYLIAVAIPSVFLFQYKKFFKKSQEFYLSKYPEMWAEKAGGTTVDIENNAKNIII